MQTTLHIVETASEFEYVQHRLQCQSAFMVPVFTDSKTHPCITDVALIAVKFLGRRDEPASLYAIPCYHADAELNMFEWINSVRTPHPIWTLEKKKLMHALPHLTATIVDVLGMEYIATGTTRPIPSMAQESRIFTYTMANPLRGDYLPMMRLVAYAEALLDHAEGIARQHCSYMTTDGFDFHNRVVIPTLRHMEATGIHIDPTRFTEHFSEHLIHANSMVYTEYHPYTTTGRVTGRFGGFNSSAINKSDGSRKAFTSRYGGDGKLVLIDFESFHLRIIAELLQYKFDSTEPIHTQLAKMYFNVDKITQAQYEAGKIKTFQMLYDDHQDVTHIPFFSRIRDFVQDKAMEFSRDGAVLTSTGRHIWKAVVDDPNPKKLFNYFLQVTEMEISMQGISDLIQTTRHLRANPTIYTYDSILFDCPVEEIPHLTVAAFEVLERGGKYPIRIWLGNDYCTMNNVTNPAKLYSHRKLSYLST